MKKSSFIATFLAMAFIASLASAKEFECAKDLPGVGDHPLTGRFEGAHIVQQFVRDYDSYTLLDKDPSPKSDKNTAIEGKITSTLYCVNGERLSVLTIQRNYENELVRKGFKPVAEVKKPSILLKYTGEYLGVSKPLLDFFSYDLKRSIKELSISQLRRSAGEGAETYVSIAPIRSTNAMGKGNLFFLQVDVIEPNPLEDKMQSPKASELQKALDEKGRVDVYGILFDFDQTTIKPESDAVLKEVAEVLTADPALKLQIVGHTDSVGSKAYNDKLSSERAEAVVDALVQRHSIARERLSASGKGFSEPKADNATAEGRALNRRVELIKQ